MKAVIKYPGSKWSIANWIISFFPGHHSYLEPFLGSGAVLFNKPRSHIETVNDLDGNVVNLFWWIKHDPERLAHEIYWTPYARQVYEDAFAMVPEDSFGKAVNFYIRLNMGHGFRTNGEKVGWKNDVQGRERAYASQDWVRLPDKIMQAAERLRGVQIENMPAVELMRRFNYPNVLVYLDPPYMPGTRHGKQLQEAGVDEETAQKATWVSQFIMEYYGTGIGQSLNDPLHTIVTKDRFALITVLGNKYVLLDIFLRMLTPEELKLAQGFPRDYIIDRDFSWKRYPISEQVKRIGNSVVPVMAQALVAANCPYLKVGERQPAPIVYIQSSGQIAFG